MGTEELIQAAFRARKLSYSPYSHYQVGAALETRDGQIFTGCNIENASYTPTVCAERTAVFKAVSQGARRFSRIAVVGGPEGEDGLLSGFAVPCGVCRQVLNEFSDGDFTVIVAKSPEEYRVFTLSQLLPDAFGPSDLR